MDVPIFLVADQNRRFLEKSEEILREAGYRMIAATDGAEARDLIIKRDLSGALINLELPTLGGFELCRHVKQDLRKDLPIIVMSPEDTDGVALAEEAGADNILFRPVKRSELLFCARTLLRLHRLSKASESSGKQTGGSIDDVDGTKTSRLSQFEFFKAFLTVEIKRARRYGFPLSVMLASLDNIDSIGERYGDEILRQLLGGLARAVRRCVRDIDIPVTLRDDTILVLMPHTDEEGAAAVAERVRKRIRKSVYREDDLVIRPSISIGETTYDRSRDRNFSQVVRRASKAMREAIRKGGDRVVVM